MHKTPILYALFEKSLIKIVSVQHNSLNYTAYNYTSWYLYHDTVKYFSEIISKPDESLYEWSVSYKGKTQNG